MFLTKTEAYKSFKEKGMSDEEAIKKANEWEEEQKKNKADEYGAAEKSLASAKDKLEKSLDGFNAIEGIEVEIDIKRHEKAMAKSIQTDKEGNIDITEYFGESQNVSMTLMKSIEAVNKKIDLLAKSMKGLAEANLDQITNDEFLRKAGAISDEKIGELVKGLASMTRQLMKSGNMFSGDILANLQYVDHSKQEDNKLSKSQTLQVLNQLKADDEIQVEDIIMFESTGSMKTKVAELVKSKATKILNL